MTISRDQALGIIKDHGLKHDQPVAKDEKGELIQESSFDSILGIKPEYEVAIILLWLGYR